MTRESIQRRTHWDEDDEAGEEENEAAAAPKAPPPRLQTFGVSTSVIQDRIRAAVKQLDPDGTAPPLRAALAQELGMTPGGLTNLAQRRQIELEPLGVAPKWKRGQPAAAVAAQPDAKVQQFPSLSKSPKPTPEPGPRLATERWLRDAVHRLDPTGEHPPAVKEAALELKRSVRYLYTLHGRYPGILARNGIAVRAHRQSASDATAQATRNAAQATRRFLESHGFQLHQIERESVTGEPSSTETTARTRQSLHLDIDPHTLNANQENMIRKIWQRAGVEVVKAPTLSPP